MVVRVCGAILGGLSMVFAALSVLFGWLYAVCDSGRDWFAGRHALQEDKPR